MGLDRRSQIKNMPLGTEVVLSASPREARDPYTIQVHSFRTRAKVDQVVSRYRSSPRAPIALYRLGHLEELRRNTAAARRYYEQLIREYPASDDADLARERLKNLRP